jgi:hypothetical protein
MLLKNQLHGGLGIMAASASVKMGFIGGVSAFKDIRK